jgi:signal transduction histidine kinase
MIGRFLFGLALLISFQMAGFFYTAPALMSTLVIYCLIALFRLIVSSEKINYFDFLFDIVFVTAVIYTSFRIYSYLTLLYLFPIFFSSILISTKRIYVFPVIAAILYGMLSYIYGIITAKEGLLNILLHYLSFFLIAFAGDNVKVRIENQEKYIKQLEEERIKMQGYERLYRVSADLAHELRNPLASMSAAVQFLKEGKNDPEFVDMLQTETKKLTTLINDFLIFSRPSDAPREEVDLSETLNALIAYQNTDKKIVLNVVDDVKINANRTFLEVALNNIIKNAIEVAKDIVAVSLRTDKKKLAIEIEDDGPGIPDYFRDKIFEPFFTTKANGTGLGLAISYRIITSFGGNIIFEKSAYGGAKFSVLFPVTS